MAATADCEKICLIPDLSCMTGLTDDTRADFRAMKDIVSLFHSYGQDESVEILMSLLKVMG